MLKRSLFLALILALVALAPIAASNNNNADVDQATWSGEVASILYDNCVTCHRPDQVAPMSLLSYAEARPWAKSIRKTVTERSMPPWFADPAHGEFLEDPRLSDEDIETITRWVEAGAPAGDLAKAPPVPTFESTWRMGEPDLIVTMAPFEVTDEMEDHYEWVKVDNTLDEDRWIQAVEIRPSFMAGAHHNLTYLAPGDATLESIQGAGRMDMDYIGGWAPGVVPMVYREGFGKLLPANSSIFFQMHYHKDPGPGTGGIDQTSVGFKFYDGDVENKLTTMWVVDPVLNIPPGEENYLSASEFTFEHDALLFNFTPHMHLRGKSMKFTAVYPDGKEEVLLDVPNYDFNWQLTYTPPEPLELEAGTTVKVLAAFDNSANNVANPDPTITVTWGEKTTDEMMIGFMDYSYVDKAEQVDMPTHSVPPAMREQMKKMREYREAQEAKGAAGGE